MKKAKFETSLKCEGCVATLSEHMSQLDFVENWEVDLNSDKKVLTVQGESIDKEAVVKSVEDAGFTAKEKRGLFGF